MSGENNESSSELLLDPDLAIIDAHHHLFDRPENRYLAEEMLTDARAGHNVVATIYCETQAFSRKHGPEWLRPLGEVEFANGVGAMHATGRYSPVRLCAGIIGHVNLTLGAHVGELLDRYAAAAADRFRGVRQVTMEYPDERPFRYVMTHRPPAGLLDHPGFERGLAEVQRRNLTFDAAVFNPSLPKIAAIADRFPNLVIVLDNMGTAVGIDMTSDEKAEVFRRWSMDLRDLGRRPNVRCKISGLGMPMWGFEFEKRAQPVDYLELAARWKPYIEVANDAFGPARCMMASNFPQDRRSCNYVTLWNALKHATSDLSAVERRRMFYQTALETYRLDLVDYSEDN
jgi:L-fuconolactonase